jgi:site-specific recombinase XerD
MMKDFGKVSVGANLARRKAAISFFDWAESTRWRSGNPSSDLPQLKARRGLPRPASTAAIREVLSNAPDPERCMIALAALAGLRCIEIAQLRVEHIDLASQRLWIIDGKGGKDRVVVTSQWLAEFLGPQIAGRRSGRLLSFPLGAETEPRKDVSRRISTVFRRAGYPITAHQLRHWFATELLRSSRNVRAVQELLGHQSLASTQLYCHVLLDDVVLSLNDLDVQLR